MKLKKLYKMKCFFKKNSSYYVNIIKLKEKNVIRL